MSYPKNRLIVIDNENQDYIGWCSAYCIDEDCNYTEEDKLLAVGIDIPDSKARGKGYGEIYKIFKEENLIIRRKR